jgi:hypothetical protein
MLLIVTLVIFMFKVRKGLLQWFYPDAVDTSENMGKQLEAYFDKKTGQWVFPGEVALFIECYNIIIILNYRKMQ